MHCLKNASNTFRLFGIGVMMEARGKNSPRASELQIQSINLYSRKLNFLPRLIRHSMEVLELTIKMVTKAIIIQPNVIHCHDVSVLPLGVFVKLFTKSKLVYDAHELESNKNGITPILSKITFCVEQMLIPSVDLFITVSTSIEIWYKKNLGIKCSGVILNSPLICTNLDKVKPRENYLRNTFRIPEEKRIYIYVGILGKGRGIEQTIQVISEIDNAHLVLLGFGELTEYVIEQDNAFDNIHYHTAVPHEQVVQFVAEADFGICLIENISLSDYYCLPNKLFEYAFAGIPVVASDFPDISVIVQRHRLGVCCSLDSESIRKAVLDVQLSDPIDIGSLRELSWEHQENTLRLLYNNLVR